MKRFLLVLSAAFLATLAFPFLGRAAGTCTVTCTPSGGGTAREAVQAQPNANDTECQARCTAAPAQGTTPARTAACRTGETCRAVFTATPTAQAGVCECRCIAGTGGGGDPVVVDSTDACPQIANASAECVAICDRRCASPTAPVRANMVRDPARQPRCVAANVAAQTTNTTGQQEGGSTSAPTSEREAVPLVLSQPIGGVRIVRDFGQYIAVLYRYAIGLAGTAAAIMLVYGGFLYLLGSASGDIGKGKEVIQDALIGLLLVLGSYTILSTVNPNTLSLQIPELKSITPKALTLDAPAPPPPTTNVCGNPATDARFRRSPARTGPPRANGEACSYDSECASRKCFMENQRQGVCSDLTENQRCKCIGSCCESMTSSNQSNTYLNDTNNGGSGNGVCASGLVCQFRENDWKCTRLTYAGAGGAVQTTRPRRPPENRHPTCRLDSECVTALGTGAACIYNSRQSDSLGPNTECSLGREGDQCQCSGPGCDLVAPPNLRVQGAQIPLGNNHGTRVIACQTGLVCAPFLRPSGTISDPRDIEYYCQRPETLTAAPSTALECRFRCTSNRTTVHRLPACTREGAEGARECLSACAGPCGGATGSNCLGLRCVPVTSDYLIAPTTPTP